MKNRERLNESDTPYFNLAYIANEMREAATHPICGEISDEGRKVEKFCKDMIADWSKIVARENMAFGQAVLDFCNVFTMVYPPNDGDCPALLRGAFLELQDALGIETVGAKEANHGE